MRGRTSPAASRSDWGGNRGPRQAPPSRTRHTVARAGSRRAEPGFAEEHGLTPDRRNPLMRRELLKATGTRIFGSYTLLRVERGDVDPGRPGQFFMLEAPGRLLPRPMSLCLAPPGSSRSSSKPSAVDAGALRPPAGTGHSRARPARQRLRPRRSTAASRRWRCRHRAPSVPVGALGGPPAVLGFRSAQHAEAAALLPDAEVVVDPVLVTAVIPPGHDILACGPEPMLRAIERLGRTHSSRGRRRWHAVSARATGARSRLTAS